MQQFENILVTISEECAEIQQAVSKALRFGLENHHPNNPDVTNADDIVFEFIQLQALIEHLQGYEMLPQWDDFTVQTMKNNKIRNVAKWQEVSFDCGTLQGNQTQFDLESIIAELKKDSQNIALICPTNQGYEYEYTIGIDIDKAIEIIKSGITSANGKNEG